MDKTQGRPALVVDDDESSRAALAAACRDLGMTVVEADTLAEGRVLLDGTAKLAVLVAGVRLPDGDGIDLAERAEATRPEVGIVVVSSAAPRHREVRWPVVVKPSRPEDLRRALKDAIALLG